MDYRLFFEASPCPTAVFDRNFVFIAVSDVYLQATLRSRDELIGRCVFDTFPASSEAPTTQSGQKTLRDSLETVLTSKVPHTLLALEYPILVNGVWENAWWKVVNIPILVDNEVKFIINQPENVTELLDLRKFRSESMAQLARLTIDLTGETDEWD